MTNLLLNLRKSWLFFCICDYAEDYYAVVIFSHIYDLFILDNFLKNCITHKFTTFFFSLFLVSDVRFLALLCFCIFIFVLVWFYSFLVLEFLSTKIHHNPRTALTHLHIIVNYQKKKIRYNLQVGSDTVRFSLDAKYCVYLECLDSQNWFPSLPFKPCMDFNFGNCELLIRVHRMFVFHMAQLQAHNTILMIQSLQKPPPAFPE